MLLRGPADPGEQAYFETIRNESEQDVAQMRGYVAVDMVKL